MARTSHPAVLIADNLVGGHSVFLAAEGWSPRIDSALVALTPEQAEELAALGDRFVEENDVIRPRLADVTLDGGAPVLLARREQVRAAGGRTVAFGAAA